MASKIYPVILSGGSGTRLWPQSRTSYPKQFLPLVSDTSLLQETARRVSEQTNVFLLHPTRAGIAVIRAVDTRG